MKNFKLSLAYLAVFAMIFTSCSKEETAVSGLDGQDTYQLQFNANLNNFNKQQNPVECRDAAPAYVLVALTDSNDDWVAGKNPEAPGADASDFIRINLKNNNGSWETEYTDHLGLPAGTYHLEYFIVYSADNEVLWVAPRAGNAFASSVDNPLPQAIVLGAGTKPYIEVDVLCFIPREEEAFGYIFFDINLIEVENNYCIFVNYCYDETGREYPALFEVDVWSDDFDGSEVVIDGEMNSVSGAGNSFAATVLCLPLPPLGEGELYYVRVTVLSAGAYVADASDFYEFTISQTDISGQPSLVPAYRHVRINCGGGQGDCPVTPEDSDGDCVPDNDDVCPGYDDNLDADGDGVPDGCDVCPGYDDNEDADGDGVPDGCDICEGGDDYIDTDGDGIPDFCDSEDTPLENCETAFMVGNTTLISLDLNSKRWGWAEYFEGGNGVYVHDLYAGAGQNDLSKGTPVGTVTFTVSSNNVEVRIDLNSGVESDVTHIYFSDDDAPTTTAPGQYGNTNETDFTGSRTVNFDYSGDGDFWLIVHAEVCPVDND